MLDADLPLAVDVLTDLVRRPLLRESDLEPERNVVLEEINGVADTPDDLVFELHAETLWPAHPYGYSILGTPDTARRRSRPAISAASTRRGYYRGNCVIAAAGNLDHDRLLEALERGRLVRGRHPGAGPRPPLRRLRPSAVRRGREERDTAQTHIVFGTDTFPLRDPRRFAISILTNVFGGGMSSRLFQRVREELGLAYAVFAYKNFHQSSGQLGVYVGTQTASADQAVDAIRAEYDRIAREGLPPDELADRQAAAQGPDHAVAGEPDGPHGPARGLQPARRPVPAAGPMLAEIDAVTADDVAAVAAEFFPPDRQTVVRLGPSTPLSP